MRVIIWLKQLFCRKHPEEAIRRFNRYGTWLECPECGWESPGLQLQKYLDDPSGEELTRAA